MFAGFANVWSPIIPSRLVKDKPFGLTVAGEPVVVFRDGKGGVGALIDRCPHRGTRLSLGKVSQDGCIVCPFHNWTFRADGSCARIPLTNLSGPRLERYGTTALPTRELAGLIWAFTGPDPAGTEPDLPQALSEPGWSLKNYTVIWQVHWSRMMESFLDYPHIPFVHPASIGKAMTALTKPTSILRPMIKHTPNGAIFPCEIDGHEVPTMSFIRPNGQEARVTVPGKGRLHTHAYCVPVDAGHVRIMVVVARDFVTRNPLFKLIELYMRRQIVRAGYEDGAILESATPKEAPPVDGEKSVAYDGPTLHFRRYYDKVLRHSKAEFPSSPRRGAGSTMGTEVLAQADAETVNESRRSG